MSQPNKDEYRKYSNQPYVRLFRVSDAAEEQNSDKAQFSFLKHWADERLMVHVRDYGHNNLSGSLPGNRRDLQDLIKDAEEKKDFRYVLVQRVDRATRGGADHLFWLEFELRKRGVRILYPGDGLPEGVPFEHSLRAFKADAAKETAMSTSQRTAQGSQFALENRRVSPHSHTPFGCYRLYCRPDHTPLFVIANKHDNQQEKRSWPDLKLIDTYGSVGGGSVGHYRKQKSELVFLVPGDPYDHETVLFIFRMRYIDRKSSRKIAQKLNDDGRPAPRGGMWSPRQVESIYENEDYTGRGVANRKSAARYNRRSEKAPQRVELDDKTTTTAEHIRTITRPMEEWFEDGEPYMLPFLGDDELRQDADQCQRKLWDRRMDPTWTRKNKKKHVPGPYLLYPLLVDKGGESLVGSISGRAGSPVPIYRHKRGVRETKKEGDYGRTFNAKALESGVLEVLQEILRSWNELQPRLMSHVETHIQSLDRDDDLLIIKHQQRDEVRDQILLYVRTLTKKTQADVAPEIARLEVRRDALDLEIEGLKRRRQTHDVNAAEVVASLKHRMEHLADEVSHLPVHLLQDVLSALTAGLVVDMTTKEIEFAFHLPSWIAFDSSESTLSRLCTRLSSESSIGLGTHHDPALFLPLAEGTCRFIYRRRNTVSCKCSRRAA